MRLSRPLTAAIAGIAIAAAAVTALPASANAATPTTGDTSLAEVLLADGNTFDHNKYDYDILTEAVLAVLAAKPGSPVGVLADGSVPLTAFLPTDKAFKRTVKELAGVWPKSERRTFQIVASLGIDTVETVLLYHVVPGVTIDSATALASDGAALPTAAGPSFTVDVFEKRNGATAIRLLDGARPYPYLVLNRLDINTGNAQIGHRITRLLLPPS